MAYCVSGMVFYLKSTPTSLEQPVRDKIGQTVIDNTHACACRPFYTGLFLWVSMGWGSLAGHTYLPCAHTGRAQQKRGGGKIRMV